METCTALFVLISSEADRGNFRHMTHEGRDGSVGPMLGQARNVLTDIIKTLQGALADLPRGATNDLAARRWVELLGSYQRQLKAVLDLEGSLDTCSKEQSGGSIDLDAARSEIRQRLARLRERGGR